MSLPNPFQLFGKNSNSTFFRVQEENIANPDDQNTCEDGEIVSDSNDLITEDYDDLREPIDPKYCAICQEKEPKYKCPSCKIKTCSVDCVKIHKQAFECTGIAPPCEFKKITSLSDQDFSKGQ